MYPCLSTARTQVSGLLTPCSSPPLVLYVLAVISTIVRMSSSALLRGRRERKNELFEAAEYAGERALLGALIMR